MEFIILIFIALVCNGIAALFEGIKKARLPARKIFCPPKMKRSNKTLYLNTIPVINDLIFSEPHFLIAGTTGSGKSTLLNRILYSLSGSNEVSHFFMIDVKKVELSQWSCAMSTIATTPEEAYYLLNYVCSLMDARYNQMLKKGLRLSDEKYIVLVIDEAADLLLSKEYGRDIERLLQRIMQVGRAAKIKCLLCTQIVRAKILPLTITSNISGRIALRCRNALESRQILDVNGAEMLPQYGYFIAYTSKNGLKYYNFEPMPEEALNKQLSKLKTL